MTESMWVHSHVQQLLQELWGVRPAEVDDDGDFPFRVGTSACWVSVLDCDPVMVRVFAHAAHGVRRSAALMTELNALQRGSLSARIEFGDGVVLVSQAVSPVGLTAPVLDQALRAVAALADEIGPLLAAMYDGATPYDGTDVDEDAR